MNAAAAVAEPKSRTAPLSPDQAAALRAAVRDAITRSNQYTEGYSRKGLTPVRTITLQSLFGRGLVAPHKLTYGEFVATKEGIDLAKKLGIARWRPSPEPASPRARAMILRALTLPTVNGCADKDAMYPGVFQGQVFARNRWIEERGYGTLQPVTRERFGHVGYQLIVTEKGQRLIEATDTPVEVTLGEEEERHLRAGAMRQVIVPDDHEVGLLNFQVEASDHMRSPRDLLKRLYDPAAIMPGTEVRLLRRSDRSLIATTTVEAWNRISFWVDPAYSRCDQYHFDVNFKYSVQFPLDHFSYRIWAPFAEDEEYVEVRPGARARAFARACGFDSLMSMRATWRARAKRNGHGGRERINGLLVTLSKVDFAK